MHLYCDRESWFSTDKRVSDQVAESADNGRRFHAG